MKPFQQPNIRIRRQLLVLGDVVAIGLAVLLALAVWLVVDGRPPGLGFIARRLYWFPILAGLWLAIAGANDFYRQRTVGRLDSALLRLVQITGQLWAIYLVIFFFSPRAALPRLFILYYGVLSFALIGAWRAARPLVWVRSGMRRRAIVAGSGPAAAAIAEALRRDAPEDYALVGLIAVGDSGPEPSGLPLIDSTADLLDTLRREAVAEIILAVDREPPADVLRTLLDCYENGVRIVPLPLLYEQVTGRVPVDHLGWPWWTGALAGAGESPFDPYPPFKRGLDVVLSLIGLGLFGLLLPVIAVALWIDSRGPLVYRQARVGQGGRVFRLIKLRSMIPDAERDTGPRWAAPGDPRVTRVGRVLRRTRLDEVPQLVNVLRGEMSLIGPRPERPEFVAALSEHIPFYRARHVVRPGITGWAQVCYPYGSSEEDARVKLEYDLYYIRHRALALDVVILLRTVGRMLTFRGR